MSRCVLTKYLHVVPVVSVKKQWHDRRQRPDDQLRTLGLFGRGSNYDFKFLSNPSSQ